MKRIMALLVALTALVACAGGMAQSMHEAVDHPSIAMDVSLGYGGAVVYQKPMPIAVTLHNQGEGVAGTVAVNVYHDRQTYDRYELAVELPQGASKQVMLPVTLTALQKTFTVEFLKDGHVLCAVNSQPRTTVSPYALPVGVMAQAPETLGYMNLSADKDELLRGEVWQALALDANSFPAQSDMLSAFGILAMDGFDARTLSERQQKALDQWLRAGGILLLGGGGNAQSTYPYFERYTGMKPGAIAQQGDITPALMAYVGMTGTPQGATFILNRPQGAAAPLAGGDQPLLYGTQVGAGTIINATFELGAVASWRTAPTLWQRVLLTAAPQAYAARVSGGQDDFNYWDAQNMLGAIPVDNPGSLYGPLAVVAAFLALAGPGAYLLLKRKDKREWMWGVVPALTLAAAAVIWAMGTASPLGQPMAVSVGALRFGEGRAQVSTMAGVSAAQREGIVLSSRDGAPLTPLNNRDGYYDESQGDQLKEPTARNFRYLGGSAAGVEFPAAAPWTVNYLRLDQDVSGLGQVSGKVWAQEDGLHALIENGTDFILEGGYLLTPVGYAAVPRLLPGEQAQAAILEGEPAQVQGEAMGIEAGKIWRGHKSAYGGILLETYTLVHAIIYPEQQLDDDAAVPAGEVDARQMRQALMNLVLPSRMGFAYVGFNDQLGMVPLAMNGAPITRSAHKGALSAQLAYEPVGPTGTVNYMPGTLLPYQVTLTEGGAPTIDWSSQRNLSFDLQSGGQRAYAFVVPGGSQLDIGQLTLAASYVQGAITFRLYNFATGAWDEQQGYTLTLTGAQAAPYVGDEGQIVVKANVAGGNGQAYGFVEMPFIQVKGRVK